MYENLAATMELVRGCAGNRLAPGVQTFMDLFSDDAVFENPYVVSVSPLFLRGKDEISAFMQRTADQVFLEGMEFKGAHDLRDADGMVIEYDGTVRLVADDRRFRQSYISVLLFRERRVCRFREYGNPLAARQAR